MLMTPDHEIQKLGQHMFIDSIFWTSFYPAWKQGHRTADSVIITIQEQGPKYKMNVKIGRGILLTYFGAEQKC